LSYHGGEQRKVAIAGVMAMKPEILILDELTVGLDPLSKKDILNKIKCYQESLGSTVIMVSHDVDMIAENADKILVLDHGRVAKYDTVNNIFSNVDELETLGLELPEVTKIFHKLKEQGFPINTDIYTIESGKEELLRLFMKQEEGLNAKSSN